MTANSPQPAKCLIHPCGNRAEIAGLCVACYRSAWNRAAGPRLPGEDPPQAGEEQPATDPLSRYAAIERQRRQLEGRLRALKQEACELEQSILDDWADRGRRKAAVERAVRLRARKCIARRGPTSAAPKWPACWCSSGWAGWWAIAPRACGATCSSAWPRPSKAKASRATTTSPWESTSTPHCRRNWRQSSPWERPSACGPGSPSKNPKSEYRNPKQAPNQKHKNSKPFGTFIF